VAGFYSARSRTIPPLPWSTFSPPFSVSIGAPILWEYILNTYLKREAVKEANECEALIDESTREIDEIMKDLESVGADPDDNECDGGLYCCDYNRTITIEFPPECSTYPCVQSITIPIRDILSWYFQFGPEEDKFIVAEVRDNFYGGDHPEDYVQNMLYTGGLGSPEERMRMKWLLSRRHDERDRKKASLDKEDALATALNNIAWQPFLSEKAILDAKQEELCIRAEALDNKWYDFVVATETRSDLPPDWISNRRSELQATTEALLGDADALSERQVELQCRVDESYSQRSGAGSIG